jgi:hypothetical protein
VDTPSPTPAAEAVTDRDGPLPALLLVLTFATGLVDAVSYLALGHVFVANMTGNVVFLGFAVAGAQDFSVPASLAALAAFLAGALLGGYLGSRTGHHRGRLLAFGIAAEVLLVGAALVLATCVADRDAPLVPYGLVVLLALAMGLQNAVARRLAVADMTTTVLTLTLTGSPPTPPSSEETIHAPHVAWRPPSRCSSARQQVRFSCSRPALTPRLH